MQNMTLLTYKEAAKFLKITKRTLAALVKERKITTIKFSKNRVRFDLEDLTKFVNSCKRMRCDTK